MDRSIGGGAQPKNILVFSDGTGNSSAKLFKTNVWRLYQAVDTASDVPAGQAVQIVSYDDGVGTSSFKPFALLGGALGVGLKRNVLELYQFVCRNYQPGDRIYAFGFSRGAFTIRVLVGLLTTIGIIDARDLDQAVLRELSGDAYRDFRRCFRLGGNRQAAGSAEPEKRDRTDLVVTPLRNLRDRRIARRRKKAGLPTLQPEHILTKPEIAFVGVWDTVAAYGSPIAEITKGIDRWVWPLSMPDYKLSEKVAVARHALALDDERDTFHPLLWDEVHEADLVERNAVSPTRLRQVWFSGMHSDVGGGYPNDSLAYVSLLWMAEEAMHAGLRLRAGELADFRTRADACGPMHDSRAGLGAYYRYQPRKISARLAEPDPTTRVVQDPDMKGQGLLKDVRVHDSILERIERAPDGYAPIVLPAHYQVEGGARRERHPSERTAAQETIWDLVWRRRLHYFITLTLTLGLVALALLPRFWPYAASTCVGPQCFISPWLRAAGALLPSFASSWVESFADRPGVFLVLALGVAWSMRKTGQIELAMRDSMRRLLRWSIQSPADARQHLQAVAQRQGVIRRLRRNASYQAAMQFLKWRLAPGAAAGVVYLVTAALAITFLSSVINTFHRAHLAWAERVDTYCDADGATLASAAAPSVFSTSDMCWRVPGGVVKEGERYRLRMDVEEPWSDGYPAVARASSGSGIRASWTRLRARMLACFGEPSEQPIAASPAGFDTKRFAWCVRWPATLVRRSTSDPWFRPLIYVEGQTRIPSAFQAVPMKVVDFDRRVYVGEFTAPASGNVILSVNDAVFLWAGSRSDFYKENEGTAAVTLESCAGKLKHPCEFID